MSFRVLLYTHICHPTSAAPEAIQKSNQSPAKLGMWAALLSQGGELRPAFATVAYPLCTQCAERYAHKASRGTWKQELPGEKRCPPVCCRGESRCLSPSMLGSPLSSLPLLLGTGLGPRQKALALFAPGAPSFIRQGFVRPGSCTRGWPLGRISKSQQL